MSKIYDGIMGLVVGDALGVPYEFKERNTFTATDMIGYGTYNQPPGTWSDDSSMTLATVESIGRLGKVDAEDIMENFAKWCNNGKFTPYGKVFDIGNTTYEAILKYLQGNDISECGGYEITDNGNGALMRILPLAFVPNITIEEILNVANLTHGHDISNRACIAYISMAKHILKNIWNLSICVHNPLRNLSCSCIPNFLRIAYVGNFKEDEIQSSGYVVHTLEAASWCLFKTDNYRDCVLTAVNLGDDTDTIAAIAGGLAGLYYGCGGEKGIPEEWISQIARKDWIKDLCDKMDEAIKNSCVGGSNESSV